MTQTDELSFEDLIGLEVPTKSSDLLVAARNMLRGVRERELEIHSLEERLKGLRTEAHEIRTKQMVELMSSAGIKSLSIDAEGNLPAYEAKLRPYYKANIAADWDEERRNRAFDELDAAGHGDLIKHTFTVQLGMKESGLAGMIREALEDLDVDFDERRAVPHTTLTAWLKEQIEKHRKIPNLDIIGATVGQIVDLKELKEKI